MAATKTTAFTSGARNAVNRGCLGSRGVMARSKATATTVQAPSGRVVIGLNQDFIAKLIGSSAAIGASMSVGDAVCQFIQEGQVANIERTKSMGIIGALITGPLSFTWNMFLENKLPGKGTVTIVKKTMVNSVFAFAISLPVMFAAVTLLVPTPTGKPTEEKGLGDIKDKIKQDLLPTFLAGSLFWPAVNMVIFRFVPVSNRAIANSLCGTVWNVYLSMCANKPVALTTTGAGHETNQAS
eukprot:CAMPEP_0203755650 /NCGR_PEP_ID=MMETSP0098-20131031/9059_1 /ASSEMBLY_ACC=CAM_ASM_000208 /TAXON_ID=96639 /ORGANISM=" , Strain NY0313808BC1" /LENGTH=239 /DNA_ID=CAMNT_0050647205 /DNA_START=273 /DNA_END=992 /DNA_ORIENTATION=+